jgi:hypothetical protein
MDCGPAPITPRLCAVALDTSVSLRILGPLRRMMRMRERQRGYYEHLALG